jgi:hypothetical protein
MVLAALCLVGLGIFGPGIANGVPRCGSSPQESARRLRQRHQLVEGVLTVKQLRKAALSFLLLSVSVVVGCAIPLKFPPEISYDDAVQPAVQLADPPKPVEIVEMPKLLPLAGQFKPLHEAKSKPESGDPRQRVEKANAAARMRPTRNGYINAVQVYPFAPGGALSGLRRAGAGVRRYPAGRRTARWLRPGRSRRHRPS